MEKALSLLNSTFQTFKKLHDQKIRNYLFDRHFQFFLSFKQRKSLAAYFTKEKSAKLLTNLCIQSGTESSTILDPSSGTGKLLIASYQRRKELNAKMTHEEILDNTFGVEISPIATAIGEINLSLLNNLEIKRNPNLVCSDFFNVESNNKLNTKQEINKVNRSFIPRVDIILGNPPFTKGDRLNIGYKQKIVAYLKNNKNPIIEKIDKKQLGLHGYFLTSLKGFLKDNGLFGFILPYSVFYTESFEIILKELLKDFGFRYIIKSDIDPAFSDSTFQEVIVIAQLNYIKPLKVVFLKQSIDKMPFKGINQLSDLIIGKKLSFNDDKIRMEIFNQEELRDQKWTILFHSKKTIDFWKEFKSRTIPINIGKSIRGNRVSPIDFYGLPNKHWKIISTTDNKIKIRHKRSEKEIVFHSKDLIQSMKRYNQMAKFPAYVPQSLLFSYYIKDNENESFRFWKKLNQHLLIKKHYPPIKRFSHIAIPQKISWNSTRTLCFFSPDLLHIGDGFMTVIDCNQTNSLLLFAYLSSSFGIFNILLIIREINRAYGQLLGPDMKYLRIPNFENLTNSQTEGIKAITQKMKKSPVNQYPPFIERIKQAQKNKDNLLYQLDEYFAEILGYTSQNLRELYFILIEELKKYAK
jgi:tRNA1(Val) A37 N6-methylase TrmN6